MSKKLPITIASWDYDRVRPIKDGTVQVEGCDVTYINTRPEETFFRLFTYQEFDVSEMSFSSYMLARTNIDFPYIALPIPISRVFAHSGMFIRTDRGIKRPEDLKGKIVGAPNYQLTRGLCIRGTLSDEYGVKPQHLKWRIGGLDVPEFLDYVPQEPPKGVEIEPIKPGQTLSQMLVDGEIDAIFTAQTPLCWREKRPKIARLFANPREAEMAYFKKTGIFHIMHLIGLRKSLAEQYPWLPRAIMKAFEEAKALTQPNLTEVTAYVTMLPWLAYEAEATMAAMGEDYWPYGIEKNLKTIDAQIRWSYEQGLSKKLWKKEELFHPATFTWFRSDRPGLSSSKATDASLAKWKKGEGPTMGAKRK